MKEKKRADQILFDRKTVESRAKAKALIMAGQVEYRIPGKDWIKLEKAGSLFVEEVEFKLKEVNPYVSRGAQKLLGAFEQWPFLESAVENKIALDIGASTGGFTQVLLEKGASKVVAIDVGRNQLHEKLKSDERVLSCEKTHILKTDQSFWSGISIEPSFPFVVTDVSFISLKKIIVHVKQYLEKGAYWVMLVKPQFELNPNKVPKGIVRSQDDRQLALDSVKEICQSNDFEVIGDCESPIQGQEGNVEYLLLTKFIGGMS